MGENEKRKFERMSDEKLEEIRRYYECEIADRENAVAEITKEKEKVEKEQKERLFKG